MNGEWGGPWCGCGCPQKPIRCIPIHLIPRAFMRLLKVMSEQCEVHTAVLAAVLSQPALQHHEETTAPLWTCVFMRAGETRGELFGRPYYHTAPSLILPFLSPPIIWLHIRSPGFRLRGICSRGEGDQRASNWKHTKSTDSESPSYQGKVQCACMSVCAHVFVNVWSEKALMNKGLNCERDKLTLRDIWLNTFIVSPAENKYQVSQPGVQRHYSESRLVNSACSTCSHSIAEGYTATGRFAVVNLSHLLVNKLPLWLR